MELFLKILLAGIFVMLIFRLWPAAKAWMENGPRAQKGDWAAVVLPLAAVVAFVALLIALVRG